MLKINNPNMDNEKSNQTDIRTLAKAFNVAIASATKELSTLIIYNNKDLALDLCKTIHSYRKGKLQFISLRQIQNSDSLREYLFNNIIDIPNLFNHSEAGTIVFENVDEITEEFQYILSAFYDHNERENIGLKLIFLSRSTLVAERQPDEYSARLFFRITGHIIDCRLTAIN